MREITINDYKNYLKVQKEIFLEDGNTDIKIEIGKNFTNDNFAPAKFRLEVNNVWSFPKRGNWATHSGEYRGNWAPEIPRNLILRYSKQGDLILDQFVGGGTTLIECKLLGRKGIGIDINLKSLMITRDRLNFSYNPFDIPIYEQKTYLADAKNLDGLEENSIDLIITHPPYADIIRYSKNKIQGDISNSRDISEYMEDMQKVALESYRVLKSGKYAAILIGDLRKNKHHIPLAFRVMLCFLTAGFVLKEDVIKIQHQMRSSSFWRDKSKEFNFLLLKHEHLFIFRKPKKDEKKDKYKYSQKWW